MRISDWSSDVCSSDLAGGAGADDHVDFVDEDDRTGPLLQLGDDRLEALFEIAPILGAGDQAAQVKTVDDRVLEQVRNLAFNHQPRETFGDRGLADPSLADQQRIVDRKSVV